MIFLKQYGAQRTGTNALAALVHRHVPDACVLMHVLGDKHSAPTSLVREQRTHPEGHATELVLHSTLEARSATTDDAELAQHEYIASIASDVLRAINGRTLCVSLSTKNPHAWIASMLRARGKLAPIRANGVRAPYSRTMIDWIRAQCESINTLYGGWSRLVDDFGARALVVRHEDLLRDPGQILRELAVQWRCELRDVDHVELAGVVLPTHWDTHPVREHHVRFDPGYYLESRYLRDIGEDGARVVDDSVDWKLFARWSYGRVNA